MPSSSGIMSDRDGLDDPLPRRCLILYSHVPDFSSPDAAQERERNIRRVVDLSNKLRERNIACRVDQYDNSSPPCNWFQWLEDQIEWCESVLLVISPAFYNAFCSRPTTPFIEQSQRDFEDVPEVELNQKLLKLACAMVAEKFGHGTSDGSNGMVPDMGIRSPRARVHPIFFDKVRPEFVPKMYCTTTSYCLPKTLSVDQPGDMRKLYAVLGQESLPETAPKPLPDAPTACERQLECPMDGKDDVWCRDESDDSCQEDSIVSESTLVAIEGSSRGRWGMRIATSNIVLDVPSYESAKFPLSPMEHYPHPQQESTKSGHKTGTITSTESYSTCSDGLSATHVSPAYLDSRNGVAADSRNITSPHGRLLSSVTECQPRDPKQEDISSSFFLKDAVIVPNSRPDMGTNSPTSCTQVVPSPQWNDRPKRNCQVSKKADAIPRHVLNSEMTDRHVMKLGTFVCTDWKELAGVLDTPLHVILTIQYNHRDAVECARDVLIRWRKREGRRQKNKVVISQMLKCDSLERSVNSYVQYLEQNL